MSDRDDDIDRLLARGQPSGPRLDRIWERIEPAIPAEPEATRARRWWSTIGLAVAPVAALGVAFLVWRTQSDDRGFNPRGAGDQPVLEATCGAAASPCMAGVPIHLRISADVNKRSAYVFLIEPSGTQVFGPFGLLADRPTPLPIELRGEDSDALDGIELRWLIVDRPLEDAKAHALRGSRLHLEVRK